MKLNALIGQPFAVHLVERWLEQATNQPLLFHGPEGVGKRTLALWTAKAMLCLERGGPDAKSPANEFCDRCAACRKIEAGQHPDVRLVDRAWQALIRDEDVEKQQAIRLETLLAERHRLLQSPMEGRLKILILDDAHRLTLDAANAFLKLLEEPPADAILILVTPFRDRLLPTIQSRCRPIRFRPLREDEMAAWSRSRPSAQEPLDGTALSLARGSPGRAVHHSKSEAIAAIDAAQTLWDELPTLSPAEILQRADAGSTGARMTRQDAEERIDALRLPVLSALHQGDARAALSVSVLDTAVQRLRQNVSPSLVYDALLLSLAKKDAP